MKVRRILLISGMTVIVVVAMIVLAGCTARRNKGIDSSVMSSVDSLYGYQYNYSKGTALLNIIPADMLKDVYDNYDDLKESGNKYVPISLREYAAINTVYLDYDTDYSIVWNKDTDDVRIEKTVIADREEYKQKQHK